MLIVTSVSSKTDSGLHASDLELTLIAVKSTPVAVNLSAGPFVASTKGAK